MKHGNLCPIDPKKSCTQAVKVSAPVDDVHPRNWDWKDDYLDPYQCKTLLLSLNEIRTTLPKNWQAIFKSKYHFSWSEDGDELLFFDKEKARKPSKTQIENGNSNWHGPILMQFLPRLTDTDDTGRDLDALEQCLGVTGIDLLGDSLDRIDLFAIYKNQDVKEFVMKGKPYKPKFGISKNSFSGNALFNPRGA